MNKIDIELSLCLRSALKVRLNYNVKNVCLFVCFFKSRLIYIHDVSCCVSLCDK